MKEINYITEALKHNYNYYVGAGFLVMMFITGTFWGWLTLFLAVEMLIVMSTFTTPVRKFLYYETAAITKVEMLNIEKQIFENIGSKHKTEMSKIRELCKKVEDRISRTGQVSVTPMLDKLAEFRYRFAKLCELHYQLTQDNAEKMNLSDLERKISENELQLKRETSSKIRSTLQTTLSILKKRLERIKGAGNKVREIEAHLSLVKSSLELIYDDLLTSMNVDDTLGMVDGLVAQLDIGDGQDLSNIELADLILPTTAVKETVYETVSRSKYGK